MSLIVEKPEEVYDLSKIRAGDVFYGKHRTWNEGITGIVTTAKEKELVIQYYPGIGNVANHFMIPVSEVAAQEWEIRWSADLSEVFEYSTDGQEQENADESGTTDI